MGMIEVNSRKKFKLVRLKDIYYAPQAENKHPGCDAVYYYNCQKPCNGAKEFKTMMVDLSGEPKEILDSFAKKTRAQIKKALLNNRLNYDICEHPSAIDLESFYKAYDLFAKLKNILPCQKDLLKELSAENRLRIASVSLEGEVLCQFALIELEDKMVCFHGYNIRFSYLDDTEKVKLISQANRALEYHCMIYAKEKSGKYYDLCGLTLEPNNYLTENVDHYKKGFKGEIVTEYNFIKPITTIGIIFCFFVHLKRDSVYLYRKLRNVFKIEYTKSPLTGE